MRLVASPNGDVDRADRALWLTPCFDTALRLPTRDVARHRWFGFEPADWRELIAPPHHEGAAASLTTTADASHPDRSPGATAGGLRLHVTPGTDRTWFSHDVGRDVDRLCVAVALRPDPLHTGAAGTSIELLHGLDADRVTAWRLAWRPDGQTLELGVEGGATIVAGFAPRAADAGPWRSIEVDWNRAADLAQLWIDGQLVGGAAGPASLAPARLVRCGAVQRAANAAATIDLDELRLAAAPLGGSLLGPSPVLRAVPRWRQDPR